MNNCQEEDYSCWVVLFNHYEMYGDCWACWVESVDHNRHGRDCFVGPEIEPSGERFHELKLLILYSDKDEYGNDNPRYVLAYLLNGELMEWDQVVLRRAEDERQDNWAVMLAGRAQAWLDRQESIRKKMEGQTQFT